MSDSTPLLVCHSHLRWDWVYQRPQHLLSRLARSRRVIFIEEPMHTDGPDHWEKHSSEPNVLVCRPRTNRASHGFTAEQIDAMKPMVDALLQEEKVDQYKGRASSTMGDVTSSTGFPNA